MKRCVLGLCLWLTMIPFVTAQTDEDAKLAALFKTYLDDWFALKPLDATRLGDHRFDHLLDDLSPEARQRGTDLLEKTLASLPKKIDFEKLSRSGQIDYEIWQHDLKRSLWQAANSRPYEQDPRVYNEYISDSVYLLLAQSTLPKERNIANCVARMKLAPAIVQAAKANLKDPPKVFVETAIRQNKGAINFYQRGIFELAGEKADSSLLAEPAKKLVPVLEEYQKFLEDELLPRAKGEWRLGKEKFAQKLIYELDAGLTADEVLKEAEAEFARVERDLYVIARQLWSRAYPQKSLPPDDEAGRRATIRLVFEHFNKEHAKPQELVAKATEDVAKIKKFIADKDILKLPTPDRCRIVEMPEFQRGNSTAYLNQAPPLDRDAASYYAISPPPRDWDARRVDSFLEEYNQRMLQILSIHEGYPGHYVQLEYSNRHPSLIRRVLQSGVFAEGWAVYTEQMMLDQGYGGDDLVLRLNQLKWYLRSVTNAILDHKMHCQEMSDQDAYKLLTEGAFQSDGEAVGKIIRAKQSSCQLSTYFVGRTAFYRLRQSVSREQGDDFSLGRFHEAVLVHGTLPVKYLPEVTRSRLKQPR